MMYERIPKSWMNELFDKAGIVQVVSKYVHLRKNGGNYWGLCPFHNEKTPSFCVNPTNNLYYCFGCKAGGNAVQFVAEMEHTSFSDAALMLGEQVGLQPPQVRDDPEYQKKQDLRNRLLSANRLAAKYYYELLWTPAGKAVLDYFHGRGLNDSVIRRFGLGASPDQWDALDRYLIENGYTQDEILLAGLAVKKEKEPFDFFRNRAMFPIISAGGDILGFGGRAIGDGKPKYLNTTDTPIFNKRMGVYAANLLKKERNLKRVILTEGYMDVVALSQMGITGVVATLGTSLTNEQARYLKRFSPQVWICYDGDEPGQHAIERAVGIFESEEINARVLQIPDGLDPDEFIRQRGREAFDALQPMNGIKFKLQRLINTFDLSNEEERVSAAKKCSDELKNVHDPVLLDSLVDYVSSRTAYSREVLYAQLNIDISKAIKKQPDPAIRAGSNANARSNRHESEADRPQQTLLKLLSLHLLPEGVLREEDFVDELYLQCARRLMQGDRPSDIVQDCTSPEEKEILCRVFSSNDDVDQTDVSIVAKDCLNKLKFYRCQGRINALKQELNVCDVPADKQEIMKQIMQLTRTVNKLRMEIK